LGGPSFDQPSEAKTLVRSTLRRGASQFTDNPGFLLRKVSFAPSILIPFNDLKSKLVFPPPLFIPPPLIFMFPWILIFMFHGGGEKGFADKSDHPKFKGKFLFLSAPSPPLQRLYTRLHTHMSM